LLPTGLIMTGVIVGVVLSAYGFWRLLRSPGLRPYRFLGATTIGVIGVFLVGDGPGRYLAGLFPLLFVAGAAEFARRPASDARRRFSRLRSRALGWLLSWPTFVVSAVLAVGCS
jgi:uncharacterized membrane protein YfcA